MDAEMLTVFSIMSVVLAGAMGLLQRRVGAFAVFALIFLNLIWGVKLGTIISDKNEFVWFSMPLVLLLLEFSVIRATSPRLWELLTDRRNYP